jgi:hypothetical protein
MLAAASPLVRRRRPARLLGSTVTPRNVLLPNWGCRVAIYIRAAIAGDTLLIRHAG